MTSIPILKRAELRSEVFSRKPKLQRAHAFTVEASLLQCRGGSARVQNELFPRDEDGGRAVWLFTG